MDAGPEPRDTPKLNRGTVSLVMPFLLYRVWDC